MIVSSLVVAGALSAGTFGVSLKAYRERKRKKEFPWTVAAERLRLANNKHPLIAARHGQKSPFYGQEGIVPRVSPLLGSAQALISSAQDRSQAFTEQLMAPFVSDMRHQQLQEISTGEAAEISPAEQEAKKDLTIASGSLLLAIGGSLFYAPLYVPSILCTAYLCRFFVKATYKAMKQGHVDIYTFCTLILVGGFAGGFFFTTTLGFWYANLMRLLLAKTEDHSRKSLVNLFGEQPRFVWVLVEGSEVGTLPSEVQIPFESLQSGDILVAMAGQTITVDGIITKGEASIDQHMLTGEGQPAEKTVGEEVFASTVVLSGKIYVRVEKTGASTVAAQIGDILNRTTEFSLSIKSRFEAFQQKSLPVLMSISVASLPWLGLNGALAVLWYAPGWRMLVFGPMSMLNFLHISSQQGILIKDGRSLELLSDIDTVVFDKTGTLTQEMPYVSQIYTLKGTEDEILTLGAAAEQRQSHPIARAIMTAAFARQLEIPEIDDAHIEIGYGVKVRLNDQVVRIGSARFMDLSGITISPEILSQQQSCHAQGYSLVYVAIDDELGGAIELQPTIRPEAKKVIDDLKKRGKSLVIISGDQHAPTRQLAQELGIDHYFANTLPENKADLVEQLQQQGRSVCFVGDGINDSIALKKANVSISLRGATTIATDTAQIVLMDESLEQLTSLFDIADEFKRNMDGSYITTIVPNLIGIGGTFLFHWGFFGAVMFNTFLWLPQLAHVMHPLYKRKDN